MNSWLQLQPFRLQFMLSLLVGACLMLLVLTLVFSLPVQVPLFYSLARPEQYLASKYWLFVFPVLSFTMTGVHLVFGRWLVAMDEFLARLFAWTSVAWQLLLSLICIRIIMIIT